jgi:hypothetical protein
MDDEAPARRSSDNEDVGAKRGYSRPELLHLMIMFLVCRSFTERPYTSNSIET